MQKNDIKIAVVCDPHIQPINRSRKDNYLATCFNKISQIAEQNDIIIFGGDLFSSSIMQIEYLYQVMEFFKTYKNKGKEFISIIGNHDVPSYREDLLNETSLGLLNLSGVLKVERGCIINSKLPQSLNIDILPLRLKDAIEYIKSKETINSNKTNILLGHHFLTDLQQEINLAELGYDYICLFHDHKDYEEITLGKTKVLRSGSLLRNAAHEHIFKQKIGYYQFIFNNTNFIDYKYVNINYEKAEDVFKEEIVTGLNKEQKKFIESIDMIIKKCSDKFDKNNNVFSIKQILIDLKMPKKCFSYLQEVYDNCELELV